MCIMHIMRALSIRSGDWRSEYHVIRVIDLDALPAVFSLRGLERSVWFVFPDIVLFSHILCPRECLPCRWSFVLLEGNGHVLLDTFLSNIVIEA